MSSKQQALKAKKQAKRATAVKQKQKTVNTGKNNSQQLLGRRETAKLYASPASVAKREAQLHRDVATKGIVQTALDLKTDPERAKEKLAELTNLDVLKGIHDIIPILATVHGGIEIAVRLSEMNKTEFLPSQVALIEAIDRKIVAVSEDINVIYHMIESGSVVEGYMAVFISYVDKVAELTQFDIPDVLDEVLKPMEPIINEYAVEHKSKEESSPDFGMRCHEERMVKVAPLYRTTALVADLVDDEAGQDAKDITPITC